MKELKLFVTPIDPPHVKIESPPWQRIYRFALGAWIFAMLSLAPYRLWIFIRLRWWWQ